MKKYNKLYSYSNLDQLRKIQEERDVYSFVFVETKNELSLDSKICIDIWTKYEKICPYCRKKFNFILPRK